MTQQATSADAPPTDGLAVSGARQGAGGPTAWTITVLTMIGFLGSVDRQVFTTLLVPIQKDLRVNDTAMGLLTGSAFALVYAFIALPLARLSDRANRRNILAAAVVIWSAATAFCGIATGYFTLLAARFGVASAEAALMPTTMSMIGDLAPPARRGAPVGIWNAGIALGFASGAVIAGVLSDHYGWHAAMMIVGLPGLVVGALMFLTVLEPVRGAYDGPEGQTAREPLIASLRRIARIQTFRPFVLGYVGLNISYQGFLLWLPPFLMRVHHLSATQMGLIFGPITVGGMVSTLAGAALSDRLARRSPKWRLYFAGGMAAVAAPLLCAYALAPGLPAAIALLLAFTLVGGSISSVSQVSYLSMAPVHMRGLVTAIMNVIGIALGGGLSGVVDGAVNDALKPIWGDQSLRYTMQIAPATMALCAVMYFIASRTMNRDVARVTEGEKIAGDSA